MDADRAKVLIGRLRETLARSVGVDTELAALGQVQASQRRASRELIPLTDHLRALILAMLAAHRPWRTIARRLGQLELVFGLYKPDELEQLAPQQLVVEVEALGCGNARLGRQMESIRPNLETMRRIERTFGCMDQFVECDSPDAVAQAFGRAGSSWKLREVGPALALEYLKFVGIQTAKPDARVRRICGPGRLGLLDGPATDEQVAAKLQWCAEAAGVHPVAFENMLWLLGERDYGAICASEPRCEACELRRNCRFPLARKLVQQSRRPVSLPS
ncbi:MAG TPA: hypothetical protein VFY71_12060 [Planctomycetota bacterium]|nr:hypothetical protein [Planctomycetota bacterium]